MKNEFIKIQNNLIRIDLIASVMLLPCIYGSHIHVKLKDDNKSNILIEYKDLNAANVDFKMIENKLINGD